MDEVAQALPSATMEPISRQESTTPSSTPLPQLPGISSLAAVNTTPSQPPRSSTGPSPTMYASASPAATSGGSGGSLPTCHNCSTSTTPLWRRDEYGSVLCNACGLFLKLHGRSRPISLKTDVIKSRNRVKTMRPDLASKKKQQQQQQQQHAQNFAMATDPNGVEIAGQATAAAQAARRGSQRSVNGHVDDSNSPISRTGTPSMYNHGIPSFSVDDPYHSAGIAGLASVATEGRAPSPLNGDRSIEPPQTHEQLIAQNSSLKTRVSELELINELFRGRLSTLEQQEATARRGQEVAGVEQTQLRTQLEATRKKEAQLQAQLEDSHRRENSLKRRLDDLELELKEAKDALEATDERPAKKPRIAEPVKSEEDPTAPASDAPATAPTEPSATADDATPAEALAETKESDSDKAAPAREALPAAETSEPQNENTTEAATASAQ